MTKAQIIILALVASLWIVNTGIFLAFYSYLKKSKNNFGISLLKEEIAGTGTRNVGKVEMLIYFSLLMLCLYYLLFLSGHNPGTSMIRGQIIATPCIALFNARKRTGKSILALFGTFVLYLNLILSHAIVGLPVKTPILEIAQSEVILNKTTISELMKEDFQIYVKKEKYPPSLKYEDILTSGVFEKYSQTTPIFVEKGYEAKSISLRDADYLFVKDHCILGSFLPYGREEKETNLEDCKIVQIDVFEESWKTIQEKQISCQINGVNLLKPLQTEEMKKVFGKNLWETPEKKIEGYDAHYQIFYPANRVFWSEYHISMKLEEKNILREFYLETRLPQK